MTRSLTLFLLSACSGGVSDGLDGTEPGPTEPGPIDLGLLGEIAFFQSVEVLVAEQGVQVSTRNAPLIASRDAVVRVMIEVPDDWSPTDVELAVDLTVGGATQTFSTSEPVTSSSILTDPDSGLVVSIPADAMAADASYSVRLLTGSDVISRFPATGEAPLDAMQTGAVEIRMVPFEVDGSVPDTSAAVIEGYRAALMAAYPVTDVTITVGEVVPWTAPFDIGDINFQVGVMQEDAMFAGDVDWDVYFFGMVNGGAQTREEYEFGVTGTSEDGGNETLVRAYFATGAAFGDQRSEDTLIHEMGHLHGLDHSPCDGESNVDPNYPYADGTIGVEGYDPRTATFVPHDTMSMMTNCYPRWISDYSYEIIADHVSNAQNYQGYD